MRVAGVVCIAIIAMLTAVPTSSALLGSAVTTSVRIRDIGTVLAWAPVPAATGYEVFRKLDDGPRELIATTSTPLLFDSLTTSFGRAVYTILPFTLVPGVTYSGGQCVVQDGADVQVQVSNCASGAGPRWDPQP